MKNSLLTVLAVSSLVVLGACAGDEAAEDATVEEMVPAPVPVDTMSQTVDTTVVIDTVAKDTTP